MSKVDLCRHFGLPISEAEWGISGLPPMLVTDRGELIGTVPTGWVDRLCLTLITLPVRRPDWKGLIEIAMRLIQERGLAVAPGALTQAQRDRGLKASEPALTLTDLWRVLLL
ncbi:MAG: hypothetical protein H3C62_16670, partial [Gemmatimonadaceae bacterium]|nr:hypothetical protein [Gemmatimonadaceae bacterium]